MKFQTTRGNPGLTVVILLLVVSEFDQGPLVGKIPGSRPFRDTSTRLLEKSMNVWGSDSRTGTKHLSETCLATIDGEGLSRRLRPLPDHSGEPSPFVAHS